MRKIRLFFLGAFLLSSALFGKNLVLTSISSTYSLGKELTKGTNIRIESVFGSDISMTMTREAIAADSFVSPKEKVDAVIDISKIWLEDNLFERIRQENIHTVEIDASYPFDSKKSMLFFNYDKEGKVIPYVWMGTKNLVRMAAIITKDLIALYPKETAILEKNLVTFTGKVMEMEEYGNKAFLEVDSAEVINLSPNINYFLNDFNIFAEERTPEEVTEETVKKIMDETGLKVFVSDRWLKKKVVKEIEKNGGSFVVLNTLDIPMDKDGKMDEEAIWKSYKNNIDALKKAFLK